MAKAAAVRKTPLKQKRPPASKKSAATEAPQSQLVSTFLLSHDAEPTEIIQTFENELLKRSVIVIPFLYDQKLGRDIQWNGVDAAVLLLTALGLDETQFQIAFKGGLEQKKRLVFVRTHDAQPTAFSRITELFQPQRWFFLEDVGAYDEIANEVRGALRGPELPKSQVAVSQPVGGQNDGYTDSNGEWIAGYASDTIDIKHDALQIAGDVNRLASVMIATAVTPPLAIGLFGPWGSGKSFYMKSLKQRVAEIAAGAKEGGPFCRAQVPVEFNAWHYVDTSLWANLVNHILDQLALYFDKDDPAAKKAKMLSLLASAHQDAEASRVQREEAQKEISKACDVLEIKVAER